MLTLENIREAVQVVGRAAWRTPLLYSHTFSHITGCELYLKAENLQRTGSFKIRGATNKIARLDPHPTRGVAAASAGNHAQGVALAARNLGLPATVVMPQEVSLSKLQATRGYGAEVVSYGEDYAHAYHYARELAHEKGLTFIDGFDDWDVMAGQGTIGLEILEDLPGLDTVLVPVGGGGLIAGIAVAIKSGRPNVRVIGVQASACPSYLLSRRDAQPVTIHAVATLADGPEA